MGSALDKLGNMGVSLNELDNWNKGGVTLKSRAPTENARQTTLPTTMGGVEPVTARPIEDAYAELDTLNAQYNDALRRLESTNREESARARAELESLSPKIDALKEETAYKGTGVDVFKYGSERIASGFLNAGENITDFIGAGVYTGIKGAAELAKATPFYQNWLDRQYKEQANARGGGRYSAEDPDAGSFLTKASEWAGEQADKFLDNSVSRDYEQSIIERYQPTRIMEQVTGLGQTVVQMLPGIGVATKAAGAASGINAAAQAANASNAGMAVFGLQAAGGGANEAKQEGATTEQALAYGAATGLMETAIESIAGGIPQLGKGKIQQVMGIIGANPAVAKALDIAGEGGEEGLSAFLTPYFKRAIYDEDAKNATAEEIAQNVIMGMAAAGVLQAGLELPGAIGNMTLPFSRAQSSTVISEQKTAPGTVNGAEAANEESTVINTDPTQHTAVEQRVIDEYQGAVDDNLVNFVETSIANKGSNKGRYTLKPVSDRAALDIKNLTGVNTSGFKTVIEQRIAEHIVNRHGANGVANKSMADINDVARMQYVIDNYDRMEYGGKSSAYTTTKNNGKPGQADTVKYIKAVNGTYYVVEAVPDTKAKTTYIVSTYMENKNEASNQHPVLADGPTSTPKSAGAAKLASAAIVSRPEPAVNPSGTESAGAAPSNYGQNTVGAAQARFKYQEADTQSVANNLFTEQEMNEHPGLQNTHQVITDAQANYQADELLLNDYDFEVERLKNEDTVWGKVENVEGHRVLEKLIDTARKSGKQEDWDAVTEWKSIYDRKGGTEAAQTLQGRAQFANSTAEIVAEAAEALEGSDIRKLNPQKKAQLLDEVYNQAEAYNGIEAGDTDSLISLIERNSEIRRTTGLFSKKTAKQMDWALHQVAEKYPETAEQFLRNVAVAQIRNIASDYRKVGATEAAKSIRIMNMLSKFSTITRNLVSNNIFDPLEAISGDVGVIADLIMSKMTGQRTTTFDRSWTSKAKWSGSLEGALKSYIEVGLDAPAEDAKSKYEGVGGGRTFKMTGNPLERLLSTWSKYQSYSLQTTDEFQKGGIRAETQRQIDSLKASGKLKSDALNEWADETAKQRTFQNDSSVSMVMEKGRDALNFVHVGNIGAGDILLPFAKVPGNLAAQGANYSPLGLLRSVVEVTIDAKRGTLDPQKQAQAARNFGRGVTGTALLAGFAALALKGLIDVAGADDEDKESLEKAQGKTGTQWNLSATLRALNGGDATWKDGDVLMSLGFLDPLNPIMAAGSLLADDYAENGASAASIAKASLGGVWQSVLDLPAMTSISSLIDAYSYAEGETDAEKLINAGLDYAGSQAASFVVPNAVRGIATGLDNTVRNQYSGETVGEVTLDSIKSGIPGLRGTLPASLDPFGREKTQTGSATMNMLNNNVLPGAFTKYKETAIEKTIESVYDQTEEAGIYPNKSAPKTIVVNKQKVNLTPEQRDEYMSVSGDTALSVMGSMIDSDWFSKATAEQQAEYLSLANEYARAIAAYSVTDGAKELSGFSAKAKEAEDAGVSVDRFIKYYSGVSDFDADDNGSYTTSERADSIKGSGLTEEEQLALWSVYKPKWTADSAEANVDYATFVDYKIITANAEKKADKLQALRDAGYSAIEAMQLYNAIK